MVFVNYLQPVKVLLPKFVCSVYELNQNFPEATTSDKDLLRAIRNASSRGFSGVRDGQYELHSIGELEWQPLLDY